jgi:hypothetical protein
MLDLRRSGDAISACALDLARVWRAARASARLEGFPGLLDGVIEPFFTLAGDLLAVAADPAEVWASTAGVVRVHARDERRTRAELDAEWNLAEQVLVSASDALGAGEAVSGWIGRAVATARGARREVAGGEGPHGILVVRMYAAAVTRPARAP